MTLTAYWERALHTAVEGIKWSCTDIDAAHIEPLQGVACSSKISQSIPSPCPALRCAALPRVLYELTSYKRHPFGHTRTWMAPTATDAKMSVIFRPRGIFICIALCMSTQYPFVFTVMFHPEARRLNMGYGFLSHASHYTRALRRVL